MTPLLSVLAVAPRRAGDAARPARAARGGLDGVAVAIGVPLGIFAARRPRLGAPLVGVANIVQTIPSLAMFGFLLPVPLIGGVGARAALVVLMLYGLLPIVRTTIAGITASIRRFARPAWRWA